MAAANSYDRDSELKAFDDTKAGVKGLVDAGVTKIPRIFIHDRPSSDEQHISSEPQISIPVIDFTGINDHRVGRRSEIIEEIGMACEKFGFFQIINHGMPESVLDRAVEAVRGFHEMESSSKKEYYTRDYLKKFVYISNVHLYNGGGANWSDCFLCALAPNPPDLQEVPSVCRGIFTEYSNYIKKLGITLLELFSELLGLNPNHLKDMGCAEGQFLLGHYYPACPEPELAIGAKKHTDVVFFNILLQNSLGGLQVRHGNRWINVTPHRGALVVSIADLLQLITNDKFKSATHRVLAQKVGPRISIATMFGSYFDEGVAPQIHGPIKELISEENPQIYRETSLKDYLRLRINKCLDDSPTLSPFRITAGAEAN